MVMIYIIKSCFRPRYPTWPDIRSISTETWQSYGQESDPDPYKNHIWIHNAPSKDQGCPLSETGERCGALQCLDQPGSPL